MSSMTTPPATEVVRISAVTAVGHIAVNTGDLARFRTFYEGLLDLPHVITLRASQPPHLQYGVFAIGRDVARQAYDTAIIAVRGTGLRPGRRRDRHRDWPPRAGSTTSHLVSPTKQPCSNCVIDSSPRALPTAMCSPWVRICAYPSATPTGSPGRSPAPTQGSIPVGSTTS